MKHRFTKLFALLITAFTTFSLCSNLGLDWSCFKQAEVVQAATTSTIYYVVSDEITGEGGTYRINVNYQGQGYDGIWGTHDMTKTDKTYEGLPIWSVTFTDKDDGLGCLQFQLMKNGQQQWSHQIFGEKDWHSASTFNGKLYKNSGNSSFNYNFDRSVIVNTDSSVMGSVSVDNSLVLGGGTTTIHAKSKLGYKFDHWELNGSSVSTNADYQITVNDDVSYTAYFTANTETVDVYFVNSSAWNQVAIYEYGAAGGEVSAWPGTLMTYSYKNEFNQDVYKATVNSSSVVIFNNNKDGSSSEKKQTGDLTNPQNNTGYYWNAGTSSFDTWSVVPYTINYYINSSTGTGTMSSDSAISNINWTLKANAFSNLGYSFAGWATTSSGTVEYENEAIITAGTFSTDHVLDLYAVWNPVDYNVTLSTSVSSTTAGGVTLTYNSSTVTNFTAASSSNQHIHCTGYYTAETDGLLVLTASGSLVPNVTNFTDSNGKWINTECDTLYAKWDNNVYSISLKNEDGSLTHKIIYEYYGQGYYLNYENGVLSNPISQGSTGTTVLKLADKTGLTFDGFYTLQNGQGTRIINKDGKLLKSGISTSYFKENSSVYAYFIASTMTVNLKPNKDGASCDYNSVVATYGSADLKNSSTVVNPTASCTGYNFIGFYSSSSNGLKVIDENGDLILNVEGYTDNKGWIKTGTQATLYAHWEAKTLSYTLNKNGGTDDGSFTINFESTSCASFSPATRTGCDCSGYYTTSGNDGIKVINTDGTLVSGVTGYTDSNGKWINSENGTLYAHWNESVYSITYKDQGNINFSGNHEQGYPTTHTFNTSTTLDNPNKSGYTFAGYYYDSACEGDRIYSIAASVQENITLYAKWLANTYTFPTRGTNCSINWYSDSDRKNVITSAEFGSISRVYLRLTADDGYWFDEKNRTKDQYFDFTAQNFYLDDVNLIATPKNLAVPGVKPLNLSTNITNGTISWFNTDHETPITTATIGATVYYVITPNPGYTFSQLSGEKVVNSDNFNITQTTLTQKFATLECKDYTLTYNANGGVFAQDVQTTKTVTYLSEIGTLLTHLSISRTGYTFGGWCLDSECQTEPITASTIYSWTEDKTVYAKWLPSTHSYTLNKNGGAENGNMTIQSGATSYSTFTPVIRTGYVCSGYYTSGVVGAGVKVINADGTLVKNVPNYTDSDGKWIKYESGILYALWEISSHPVEYNLDGGSYAEGKTYPTTFTYDETYEIYAPSKTGNRFLGWKVSSINDGAKYSTDGETWNDVQANTLLPGSSIFYFKNLKSNGNKTTLTAQWSDRVTINITKGNNISSIYYKAGTDVGWLQTDSDINLPNFPYGVVFQWYAVPLTGYVNDGSTYTSSEPFSQTLLSDYNATAAAVPGVFEITLDSGDATTKGTEIIWLRYNDAYYKVNNEGNLSGEINETEESAITIPIKDKYIFNGYYYMSGDIKVFVILSNGTKLSKSSYVSVFNEGTANILYADWSKEVYTITYHENSGVLVNPISSYSYGDTIELPTVKDSGNNRIYREGYTFGGWYSNNTFQGDPITSISATEYGNKEYWAKWTANTYTITLYERDQETIYGTYTVTFGSSVILDSHNQPVTIGHTVIEGYSFLGWYTTKTGNSKIIDEEGYLLSNSTYTDSNGCWKSTSNQSIYSRYKRNVRINISEGKGITSSYLSTSSTATSGLPSGTQFDVGLTVYEFVTINNDGYLPHVNWDKLDEVNIYRVGSYIITESSPTSYTFPTCDATSKVFTITLNFNGGSGDCTETIYLNYNDGYYLENTLETKLDATNGITVPSKENKFFKGYADSNSVTYIDENGKITSNAPLTLIQDTEINAVWNYGFTIYVRDTSQTGFKTNNFHIHFTTGTGDKYTIPCVVSNYRTYVYLQEDLYSFYCCGPNQTHTETSKYKTVSFEASDLMGHKDGVLVIGSLDTTTNEYSMNWDSEPAEGSFNVYCSLSGVTLADGETMYAYVWAGAHEQTAWRGVPMTKITSNGQTYYKAAITALYTGVVFNSSDDTIKTSDLPTYLFIHSDNVTYTITSSVNGNTLSSGYFNSLFKYGEYNSGTKTITGGPTINTFRQFLNRNKHYLSGFVWTIQYTDSSNVTHIILPSGYTLILNGDSYQSAYFDIPTEAIGKEWSIVIYNDSTGEQAYSFGDRKVTTDVTADGNNYKVIEVKENIESDLSSYIPNSGDDGVFSYQYLALMISSYLTCSCEHKSNGYGDFVDGSNTNVYTAIFKKAMNYKDGDLLFEITLQDYVYNVSSTPHYDYTVQRSGSNNINATIKVETMKYTKESVSKRNGIFSYQVEKESNALIIIIVSTSILSLSGVSLFLFLKRKRKHQSL